MRSNHHHERPPQSADEPDRYTYDDAVELEDSAFEGGTVGRRTFLSIAAATGAALALPSTVTAQVSDDRVTEKAAYAANATPQDYEVSLVFEFETVDAVTAFYDEFGEPDWDIDENLRATKVVYREEPTPAAHGWLTADELQDALDEFEVEFVEFSPGANPFWALEEPYGEYDVYPEYVEEFDVFPRVEDARDFISHGEAGQALDHLEAEYPDMVNVERIGHGPGHENHVTGEDADQRDIYVAELTNDVQDRDAFEEKDKAVFIVGIHANEQAGRESGSRILEQAAKGESEEFNPLLDDIVISFVYINPDGWIVRKPHIGNSLSHARGNASGLDTNRQYATIGWADPSFWPAEPDRAPDVRPGYDVGYDDVVPDAMATVEFLREYDNVEYVCDYHMMGFNPSLVLNLESNAAYDHDGTHNLDEVNRQINDGMYGHWGSIDAIRDDLDRAQQDTGGWGSGAQEFFNWGTIYDSIGYNVTGALLGWAGQSEEDGGLGAVTVAPELGYRDFEFWRPYVERHLAQAYHISMREFAEMCAADTNATVVTGGNDTAYVTADELTRTSADLSHTDESPGRGRGPGRERATEVQRRHGTVQPGPDGRASTTSGPRTHSLSVHFHAHGVDNGVVKLVNPAGQVVDEVDVSELEEDACCMTGQTSFYVPAPADGDWSLEFDGDGELEVDFTTVETDEEHPDPEDAFGYSQAEYSVNPMQFFDDLAPFVEDGSMEGISAHHVRVGRLMRGRSGERRYDKLVISGDFGRDDPAFLAAVEEFVEAGGDLLLTDTGVTLLADLEVGDAAALSEGDFEQIEVPIANLEDRDFDHHLLTDIRELQLEMWKGSQVGYTTGPDSPGTVIDEDAFESAGGEIAGTMGGAGVAAGTLSAGDAEINVLGSVLPVANQRELHPFGMSDYAVSFMGHTLICNALGFEQHRYVNDELVGVWGELR
ncbi:M14 family zinc carboxypeptidase [Natrononativus amylolyticus]|uniref:M14 family zinc carboxypeptidase n=1 Tax=Natrononativus amylolyticus TaxID=2963434 RepID=UPI0020CC24F2|nr:M14 family zinc carboxypeptidase [Natrononativus amylolyticus]